MKNSDQVRPIVRAVSWILGIAFGLVAGLSTVLAIMTIVDEGVFKLSAWRHTLTFLITLLPCVIFCRYFMYAAWTGKNPAYFSGDEFSDPDTAA
jgi:hypothetical protein